MNIWIDFKNGNDNNDGSDFNKAVKTNKKILELITVESKSIDIIFETNKTK